MMFCDKLMEKDMLENTKLYQELQNRESKYKAQVDETYKYASEMLPKINRVFANYTGHGIEHSVNVMQYMYDLVTDISAISDLEITCLIYAALLHDIGMTANETEIEAIKKDELNFHGRKYSVIYDKYQNENIALQECVRPVHGERASDHIKDMKKEFFIIPEYTNCNFQMELAKICQAHTMNREWVLQNLDSDQVKGKDELNAQYVAMLLRIADYLDIDEKRAPIELYRFLAPVGFGDEEWRQHYIVENKDKVVKDHTFGNKTIVIYGQCDEPKIYRKFLQYLSGVSEELSWCTSHIRNHFKEKYWVLLQSQIDNRIQTKGFEISDLKMQMDYYAVINLLMGENVYGDKRHGLRELVQNAMDACKVMTEEAEYIKKYRYDYYIPKIQIILDYQKQKAIVMDNGIGMGKDVLTKYFLNVGKSYYKSNEFLYQGKSYCPIGTFGIGFLACFMLSESVTVETKHYTEQDGFTIELEKDSEFVCKKNHVELLGDSGTAVMLDLESVLEVFDRKSENIKEYIENTFLNQGVEIQFITINDEKNSEVVNLKEFEDLNLDGIKLDNYLNGISAFFKVEYDNIKVSKKLSDLCTDDFWKKGDRIFAEYHFDENILNLKDLEGDELGKYIENNRLIVLKVEGIKKEEKELYKEWKKWNSRIDFPPDNMLRNIYFPIKYSESLLAYDKDGGHSDGGSGATWHYVNEKIDNEILQYIDIIKILSECKMLRDWVQIEIGIFPIIKVGSDRFIEYYEYWWGASNDDENETYWHGIRLDKGRIVPEINIVGLNCSKCIINILNKDIFPNVARDNLTNTVRNKVVLAVERAAYQYIASKLIGDRELNMALQDYISENYSEDNPFYAMD